MRHGNGSSNGHHCNHQHHNGKSRVGLGLMRSSPSPRGSRRKSSSSSVGFVVRWVVPTVIGFVVLGATFYAGLLTGMHVGMSVDKDGGGVRRMYHQQRNSPAADDVNCRTEEQVKALIKVKIREALDAQASLYKKDNDSSADQGKSKNKKENGTRRFPMEMSKFAFGAVRANRDEFMETFDYGVPKDHNVDKNTRDMLLLYADENYMPNDATIKDFAKHNRGDDLPLVNSTVATQNCESLSVVLTQSPCLAIVGAYQSFHVQRWLRSKNWNNELKHVGRGKSPQGGDRFGVPKDYQTQKHWKQLQQYLGSFEDVTGRLKPVLEKIQKDNTVVVMVCNHGQSSLLLNFACSSRARGIDLSNVLVFATDKETLELTEKIGLTAFYDEKNFGDMPSKAANVYMDRTFTAMMYAKVIVVQLVNMLGYDVLYQDVDMQWYTNPIDLFHDKSSLYQNYDMLLQDDGARSARYAPFCANSGFYYVRYNERTKYFFINLLFQSDLIMASGSHQQIMSALLVEHSSMHGLRVKTLETDKFPGGFQYHRRAKWNIFRDMDPDKKPSPVYPLMFHMSWTTNKNNKLLFMKQMGMWYLQETCSGTTVQEIVSKTPGLNEDVSDLVPACCSAKPLITCHYRDKPAIVDCSTSDPIDRGGRPFWKKK